MKVQERLLDQCSDLTLAKALSIGRHVCVCHTEEILPAKTHLEYEETQEAALQVWKQERKM